MSLKFKKILLTVIISTIPFLYFISYMNTTTKALSTNGCIEIPFSARTPTIDGKWTQQNEWSDAKEITLKREEQNHTVYIFIKHNTTHLFVLIDFLTDFTQSSYDKAGICLDTNENGGQLPEPDDYLFSLCGTVYGVPLPPEIYRGTGHGENLEDAWIPHQIYNCQGKIGFTGENDPYENEKHRIYEFQINLKFFPETNHYGVYIFVCDYHTNYSLLEWPENAGGKWEKPSNPDPKQIPPPPDNWGSIKDHFIGEKFDIACFMLTAGALTFLISRFRRNVAKA